MPDPKTTEVTLTNKSEDGPRSFWAADGSNKILRPGESWTGTVLEAELKDLSPDLAQNDEEVATAGLAGGDDTGAGNAAGSGPAAGAVQLEADTLARNNSLKELQEIAKKEEVAVESDDNKQDLALKIARARAGVTTES